MPHSHIYFLFCFIYLYTSFVEVRTDCLVNHPQLSVMRSSINALLYRFSMHLQTRGYSNKVLEIPMDIISLSIIKRTMKAQKIHFEDGHTCLAIQCTICSRLNKDPLDCKVHVNKTTGAFICACNYAGQWDELKQSFDSPNTILKSGRDKKMLADLIELSNYLKGVYEKTVVVNSFCMQVQNEIADKFGIKANFPSCANRGPHIFDVLKVRVNGDRSALYFPVRNSSNRLTVGFTVLSAAAGAADPPADTQPQLAHLPLGGVVYARANPRERCSGGAVVVASVRDLAALVAASVRDTVVVAPSGLDATLSQYVLPCFEAFERVTLWLGEGGAAWDTARTFARKLGEQRCHIVRTSTQQARTMLPHQLASGADVQRTLQAAQPLWHKSITTFAALRDDVLAELTDADRTRGVPWRRFPALTRALKGHRRGELTVLTGPTGSGKTTFVSEYSLDLAMQGVITLWGSFEIRNARLARTMLQQHAGVRLDAHLAHFDRLADAFQQLPIYYMTFHGQQPVRVVMDAIEHAAYVHDIAHVIIDNVQFMLGVGGGGGGGRHAPPTADRFQRQDQVVAAFRGFATQRNCHVTLVIHPRKERDDERLTTASIFGGAKASQEADNVLIVQDAARRSALAPTAKYLQIAKNRYSGDLGVVPLDFDKETLSFAQKARAATDGPRRRPRRPRKASAYFADSSDSDNDGDGSSSDE